MITGSHHMQAYWIPGDEATSKSSFPSPTYSTIERWVSRRDVFLVGPEYSKRAVDLESHLHRVPRHRRPAAIDARSDRDRGAASPSSASPARRATVRRRSTSPPTTIRSRARRSTERRRRRHHRQSGAAVAGARRPRCAGSVTASAVRPTTGCDAGLAIRPGRALRDDEADPAPRQPARRAPAGARSTPTRSFAASRYWTRRHGAGVGARVQRPHRVAVLPEAARSPACRATRCTTAIPTGSSRARATATPPARSVTRPSAECRSAHAPRRRLDGSACYNCHMPHTTYGLVARDAQPPDQRARACRTTSRPGGRTRATSVISIARWRGRRRRCSAGTARRRPSLTRRAAHGGGVGAGARARRGRRARAGGVEHGLARGASASGASGGAWRAPHLDRAPRRRISAVRYIGDRSLRAIDGFADLQYDYVAPEEARWAAQREAARASPGSRSGGGAVERRAELLFDGDGRFVRGELERLIAERDEDDQECSSPNERPAHASSSCTCASAAPRCFGFASSGSLLEAAARVEGCRGTSASPARRRRLLLTLAHAHGVGSAS